MTATTARPTGETRKPRGQVAAQRPGSAPIAVAGIGASAGGLEAFGKLLDVMPSDTGMAFVLIQHLDPHHESLMAGLLESHTHMAISQVASDTKVEPDHVYLIPPAHYLALEAGVLKLTAPPNQHGARLAFDFFLQSLAKDCGSRAVAVILSGKGVDGSLGAQAVKTAGGLVIAQDPKEAAFEGMPQGVISSGAASLVLPITQIPLALVRFGLECGTRISGLARPTPPAADESYTQIIELLALNTTHDFLLYKQGTLHRRIDRRMALAGLQAPHDYLGVLRVNPAERELLAKDLLINVTSFFRDPSAFAELEQSIIPELIRRQAQDLPLRVWVPGCSTGEEAYSIAMLFLEQIAAAGRPLRLQLFASDIDADCVSFARNGLYPEAIEADIGPKRLGRFFTKEDRRYQVARELRESVVFTVQSVLSDAPFSRLDMVSCRNLLIYLSIEAQQRVLALFHFALRESGVLFLGSAETVSNLSGHFEPISRSHRIYRHLERSRPGEVHFPVSPADYALHTARRASPPPHPKRPSAAELSQLALLDAYAPASVLINAKYECLFFVGQTERYLKIGAGEPTRDLFELARDDLVSKLRSAIRRAQDAHAPTDKQHPPFVHSSGRSRIAIAVRPIKDQGETLFLLSFIESTIPEPASSSLSASAGEATRIVQLEQDLAATREDLQNALADLDRANEEQKAVSEEAMSVNEEFQLTNEELETSKEELQSLNEELSALNSQLHETVAQQRATSGDLQNILNSTDVATLFLDADLRIRFFTPAAKALFNVIDSDVGRPLTDLSRRFDDSHLTADGSAVLAGSEAVRREVQAEDGAWYIRGMLPYQSDGQGIAGVVITFTAISEIKAAEREIELARDYLDSIIATIRQPLVVLDDELKVISISDSFQRVFSVQSANLVGKSLLAAAAHLDVPQLRDFLASIRATGTSVTDHEVNLDLPELGRRAFLMSATILREAHSARRKILIAIVDVTQAKREALALEAAKSEAERANAGKSRFLAAASHDLRQPLQTISLLQGLLERNAHDDNTQKLVRRLDETVATMSSMLNKLLDINQLEAGVVRPSVGVFPVRRIFEEMQTEFDYYADSNGLDFRVVPSTLDVRSDPRLLEQIIRNLLTNAVKYTARGKVLLGCRRRGDWLRIEVWDTGPGIPEAELAAIFEEFHQLDNPARQRSKGLGLGLAIVQRLAALLGHRIDVRSRLASGTVFSIEVPLATAAASDETRASDQLHKPARKRTGTILIVDDDPSVREMLQMLFEEEGYLPMVAADGRAALDLAAGSATEPDLIVADYNLPNGPNGLDVIAKLQDRSSRHIPAIILTGDISSASLKDIAGRDCLHLNKPVKASQLVEVVERLLTETLPELPDNPPPPALDPSPPGSQTVFVVDDDSAVRDALRDFLKDCGYSVELFADGPTFIATLEPSRSGCLLVDAVMPGMSGIDVIEHLKRAGITLPAIVITGNGAVSVAVEAMKAGAADFIEKPVRHDELLAAIARAIAHTQTGAGAVSRLRAAALTRMTGLTSRQRQILDMVLAGHPSKNIAADLGISQRTVDNHRAAIMRKTGSKSIPALIRTAIAAA